jgi:para-nitrobenzyl esterase
MRLHHIALGFMLGLTPALAFAQVSAANAATPAATHYSTANTPLGDILDNPAAKAILDKHAPSISQGPQVDLARGMTLASLQTYAPDVLGDKVLAAIDADFAKLPAK